MIVQNSFKESVQRCQILGGSVSVISSDKGRSRALWLSWQLNGLITGARVEAFYRKIASSVLLWQPHHLSSYFALLHKGPFLPKPCLDIGMLGIIWLWRVLSTFETLIPVKFDAINSPVVSIFPNLYKLCFLRSSCITVFISCLKQRIGNISILREFNKLQVLELSSN